MARNPHSIFLKKLTDSEMDRYLVIASTDIKELHLLPQKGIRLHVLSSKIIDRLIRENFFDHAQYFLEQGYRIDQCMTSQSFLAILEHQGCYTSLLLRLLLDAGAFYNLGQEFTEQDIEILDYIDFETFKRLDRHWNATPEQVRTFISKFSDQNCFEAVDYLMGKYQPGPDVLTKAFANAIFDQNLSMAEYLCNLGVNIDGGGEFGDDVPLYCAILNDWPEGMDYLLSMGASPAIKNAGNWTLLDIAGEQNAINIIESLYDRGFRAMDTLCESWHDEARALYVKLTLADKAQSANCHTTRMDLGVL